MRSLVAALLAVVLAPALSGADKSSGQHKLQLAAPGRIIVADVFSEQEKPRRRLTRGDWKVAGGVASCVQDEELFKKFNNHGPAIWYDETFKDAIIRFELEASSDCQQFVFTVNGKGGHVFRFVMNEMGTDVRAWDANHQGKRLVTDGPRLAKETWIPVTVELVGPKASVQIGDKFQARVEDASYSVEKTVVGVSFHHGTLKLRGFEVLEAVPRK